ncbi:magnesium transporter [Paracoccus suum]|uniref:Magnesium transport protein CorA n=1 Tax=Paracoccus suum TaxID=2259340 RepID=A0A344PH26_9RHOB|nr:magnesium transporter CorA family protein [Paracoccus suum]AXC48681.1 magnesium transporter [Paracoccus suum]
MIHAYATSDHCLVPLPEDAPLASARWIDMFDPQPAEVAAVDSLGFSVPTLEDMEEIEISNRLFREGETDYMTAVLPGAGPDGRIVAMPVTFILSLDRLVTVRHHEPRPFVTFPTRADRGTAGVVNADRIFLGLMEETVSRLADLIEGVGRVLDLVGGHVFDGGGSAKDAVLRVALMKIGQQAEVMARVRLGLLSIERVLSFYTATADARDDVEKLRALSRTLNRDVQALEVHADFLGNRIGMTVDATLGLINLQQNNTVRVLSVVAALFLPPTVIASIYGMNFDHMPELHWAFGYPFALGLMALSALLIYLLAKWKKWL